MLFQHTLLKSPIWIFIIFIILRVTLLKFGLPFILHPDEVYIIKDPFKLANNYSNFIFNNPLNITYYFHLIWYGILFILGYVFSFWNGLQEFKGQLAIESPIIIIWGRLLSLILSVTANVVLFSLIKKISSIKFIQWIFLLTIMFNPFELISNTWIKYDPYVYLMISIILYNMYVYMVLENFGFRKRLYFLIFIGLAVRIDLIIALVALVMYDIAKLSSANIISYVHKNWVLLFKGVLIFLLITLEPLRYWYNWNNLKLEGNKIVKPFWEVILSKIFTNNLDTSLEKLFVMNSYVYIIQFFLFCLGPLSFYFFFISVWKRKKIRPFFTMFVINSIILLIFPLNSAHYFLINSIIVIVIVFYEITHYDLKKSRYFLIINAIWITSISIVLYFTVVITNDPRIEARNFLLGITNYEDLIGVENMINPGMCIPLDEKKSVLKSKAMFVRETLKGSGLTFDIKAERVNDKNARKLIGICNNYDWGIEGVNRKWYIRKEDIQSINQAGLDYFVTTRNYDNNLNSNYKDFLKKKFTLIAKFEPFIFDPRVDIITCKESFLTPAYIWKKKVD